MAKKRILIIEDEPVLLEVLNTKLEHAGYEVVRADDGEKGLSSIKSEHPDLVLLDLLLPKKSGLEVLEEMRKSKEFSSLPVIVISNSGQPVEVKRVLELGAKDYLVKADFDPDAVIEKVKHVLGENGGRGRGEKKEDVVLPVIKQGKRENELRVLVVEDDKFLRSILAAKLRQEGFEVEEAADGGEAMKKIEEFKPKSVLLDLIMPDIDGFEVLKRMKESEEFSKIPVLVLSNLGQDEEIRRAKELGAKDYLVKAYFTPGEIVIRMQKILREIYF